MLEALIRPFEERQVTGTRRLVGKAKRQPVETAQLIWGSAGTLPTAVVETEPDGTTTPAKVKARDVQNVETTRTVEEVRVENPDDATQFVTVERIRTIEFDFTDKEAPGFLFTLNKTTGVTTITNTGSKKTGVAKYSLNKTSNPSDG